MNAGVDVNRPVIGITAGIEQAQWRAWHQEALLSPRSYAEAVERAGAMPLLLPPTEVGIRSPDAVLELVDALILSGGSDLNPQTYGAEPHPRTGPGAKERDHFEIALARAALDLDMTVLGICRGMQVLNVATGGTLIQHLPDLVGTNRHSHTPGAFDDHEVRLEAGSHAARAAAAELIAVKSHHHQGIDRIGDGLVVTGWSVPDDVVEALEHPRRRFALGVLWHPEEQVEDHVIGFLVQEARATAEALAR
jgi:putative glutamine amidotransferase